MKKNIIPKKINYLALFSMGIILIAVGSVFLSSSNKGVGVAFIALGALYMIIGGKNKEKWQRKKELKNQRKQ